MARMLGCGRSGYFCVFGWRCRCERGGWGSRNVRPGGRVVDRSRRQLRSREARLVADEIRARVEDYSPGAW